MLETSKIKILIVDDERPARMMIRHLLGGRKEIEIAGECENGREAIAAIEAIKPDLVFLDVQMPEVDGFEVIKSLAGKMPPQIVFVTAYDQYAVRAFEVHALDYLLKPFDRERFEQALTRAVSQIESEKKGDFERRLFSLLKERESSAEYLERFIIKANGRVFFLKSDEIMWIEAEANYVALHAEKQTHLFREAISSLETKLDPRRFRRIGRSAIVNLDFVRELQVWSRGDYKVILKNGAELKLSHRYRDNLSKYLGGNL
jgi:two-component system LytT family response regulator